MKLRIPAADAVSFGSTGDVRELLRTIGLRFLKLKSSGRAPRLFRIIASLPEECGIGPTFYRDGIRPALGRMCAVMEKLIAGGALRPADPWTMALHLKGLLDRDLFERTVLDPADKIPDEELERAADDADDAFLRAYGA